MFPDSCVGMPQGLQALSSSLRYICVLFGNLLHDVQLIYYLWCTCFSGVPAVVDFAAMRDAVKRLGGDPEKINPVCPADLVIDHSVQVDVARRLALYYVLFEAILYSNIKQDLEFIAFLSPKARDGRYWNAPIRLSHFVFVLSRRRIAVFPRNFAGTCNMSWECAVYLCLPPAP